MENEKEEARHQIYDKVLKRIINLSKAAVINFINGLFEKDYSLDSELTYNETESIDNNLDKAIADVILTVNGTDKYHFEAA